MACSSPRPMIPTTTSTGSRSDARRLASRATRCPSTKSFAVSRRSNRHIRRAFRVPDASLEPWQLIEANLADARAHGSHALAYHELVSIGRNGRRGGVGHDRRSPVRNAARDRAADGRLGRRSMGWPGRGARRRQARDGARQGRDARLQPADDGHDDQPLPPARGRRHHGPGPHRGDPRDDRRPDRGSRPLRGRGARDRRR